MSILSHLHQLFNTDTCHTYIHTLRWKDRPLQCPRCHSHDVDPWGTYHYRPGCKRYWCNGCQRTFNDLTNTLLHQSQRSLPHWILTTFLLCLACSSQRIAREVGVHIRTSYRWGWWLRNAAMSYEMHRQLDGTVEADGLCRKFAFETICAMVSPGNLRCTERENDNGDQFQGSPFSTGYYSDGGAVVCRLSLELPACRRADAGTWCAGRPRDHSALGREI